MINQTPIFYFSCDGGKCCQIVLYTFSDSDVLSVNTLSERELAGFYPDADVKRGFFYGPTRG